MKRSYRISMVLMSLIMIISLIAGCGSSENSVSTTTTSAAAVDENNGASTDTTTAEEIDKAFEKYDPVIEITGARVRTSWMGFDPGEDENNNWWTKTYLDQLGIKFTQKWTAPNWGQDYDQKFNVALATNDLPDVFQYASDYNAMQLIKAGKAADLTQVFNEYASEEVKRITSLNDGQSLDAWTIGGKLYGISNAFTSVGNGQSYPYVWIRSDWLKALNLEVPKTMEELENVAREFVKANLGKANGNYGIVLDKQLHEVDEALSSAFQAKSKIWFEKDGSLVYGAIQPEYEQVWEKAAQWYKEGIFPKDFAIKDAASDIEPDVVAEKVGIILGTTNTPNGAPLRSWRKVNKGDMEKDWIYIRMPSATDKPTISGLFAQYTSPLLISTECKNPEAVIKMMNLATVIFGPNKPDYITNFEFGTSKGGNMVWWDVFTLRLDDYSPKPQNDKLIDAALKEKKDISELPLYYQDNYGHIKNWMELGFEAPNFDLAWSIYKLKAQGGSVRDENVLYNEHPEYFYISPFWGNDVQTVTDHKSDWGNKKMEYGTRAIMSGDPEVVKKEFSDWMSYFYKNGGTEATKDVNDWYAAHKK